MYKKVLLGSIMVLPLTIGNSYAQSTQGIVTATFLNVRTGASTSNSIKFLLHKGEKVNIISSYNGWYEISTQENKTGWVSSKYIEIENTTITKQISVSFLNMRKGPSTNYSVITVLKKGQEVEVISEENGWAKINYNSKEGYVSSKYLKEKIEINTTTKYVTVSTLNIRSGEGTNYKILGTCKYKEELKVVSINGDWAKIQYKDGYGYVSNKYLSSEKPITVTTKYVTVDTLNIRSGEGTNYKILGTYKYKDEVKVVSENGNWAKIQYKDGYAYVSNKYLSDKKLSDSSDTSTNGEFITYENLSYSFDNMVDYEYKLSQEGYNKISANLSTDYSNSTKYINATRSDLSKYLNPNTFTTNSNGKLQFLRIDQYRACITASELNSFFSKYCKSNSVFLNKGQAFIDAAKKYNIDVSYLVAASMVETGYGNSTLAQGVYVNTSTGEKVKVYNFFGISAYDGTAVLSASNYAYKKGWTTVDKTIEGSAQWLSNNYIHSSKYNQNTLYKMRWMYNIRHQYATDVSWSYNISKVMNNIILYYNNSVSLEFLIPKYK